LIALALLLLFFSFENEAKYDNPTVENNVGAYVFVQTSSGENNPAAPDRHVDRTELRSILSAYDQLDAQWVRFHDRAWRYERAPFPERLQARYDFLKMREASLSRDIQKALFDISAGVLASSQCARYFEPPRFSLFSRVFANEAIQAVYSFAEEDKICFFAMESYNALKKGQSDHMRMEHTFFRAVPHFNAAIMRLESKADPRILYKNFLELL
jgi:hypothetical protein